MRICLKMLDPFWVGIYRETKRNPSLKDHFQKQCQGHQIHLGSETWTIFPGPLGDSFLVLTVAHLGAAESDGVRIGILHETSADCERELSISLCTELFSGSRDFVSPAFVTSRKLTIMEPQTSVLTLTCWRERSGPPKRTVTTRAGWFVSN